MEKKVSRRQFLIAGVTSLASLAPLAACINDQTIIPLTGPQAQKTPFFLPLISHSSSQAATSTPVRTATATATVIPTATSLPGNNPNPPAQTVKLIFLHHSTGEAWLRDGLGAALRDNHYFVSDTNYGWGPADQDLGYDTIGDHTDIGHWYNWFVGPHRDAYLTAVYAESGQHCTYPRLATTPAGENQIIMFKSCYPNSDVNGNPNDPPTTGTNPLQGQSGPRTVGNIKRIYNDLKAYFSLHPEKLFVVICTPPLRAADTSAAQAANARAVNLWLMNDWLSGYSNKNVAVFDFYNVLSSNTGSSNDLNLATGNHHRYQSSNGSIEYITNQGLNTLAYPTGDSHPATPGNLKAAGEFLPLLNVFYHKWKG